jgi:hypothetical protein
MEDHMARTEQPHEKVIETWEIQTEGTVWVWIYDRREDRYVKQRVGGRQGGSKRLHISTDDRRYNQEQIVDEMKGSDPFLNGALRLVSADKPEDLDTTYHLTLQDLQSLLEVRDLDLFEEEVRGITSELTRSPRPTAPSASSTTSVRSSPSGTRSAALSGPFRK